ncbi:hypothetical protein DFH06DRAFT_1330758 [Mycena polygramma]|nr:hypothetical protein DFH06DRAFT_1330758 [Mycena polygramma]
MNQINSIAQKDSSQDPLIFDSDSGWFRNTARELMFWVPPGLHEGLYLPPDTLAISNKPTTKLDISHFVHGTAWTKCIDQKWNSTRIPDESNQGAHAEDPAL